MSLRESLSSDHAAVDRWWHPTRLVQSIWFEVFYAVLILLQAVGMALEVQRQGLEWGDRLQYPGYEGAWEGISETLEVFDVIFGCFFAAEVVLKIWGLKMKYFRSFWRLLLATDRVE